MWYSGNATDEPRRLARETLLMAGRHLEPDSPEVRERWGSFAWTSENAAKAREVIARYPEGRQRSAVMPLLDLAQRQVGVETNTQGWLPIPVMEFVAAQLGMPAVRVLEVASFYTMYNLAPVGRFHVQVCGTTPCMLRGSDDILSACYRRGMKKGQTTADGLWTLTEVECLGSCASAPMVQINDGNYEDLTAERFDAVLDALAAGQQPKEGTQDPARHTVEPVGEPTSLKDMVTANHDYRGEW
jgi:NADH-quinone oxidoreductase subunit E